MGSVYEAEHLRLGTRVAIKVLHSDLARRSGLVERFLQEASISAQIRSPHVVQVTDVEATPEGVAYLVMELLQGEALSAVEKREGALPVAQACEYARQILQALEAAHALGVIHRDLKPDNVFVTFDGGKPVLKLIDFGIAKLKRAEGAQGPSAKNLTVAGMLMGTAEYMAPEQAYSAADIDVRADLYSVGVMLYEMLSGQTPVQGDDPRVVVLKVERGEVVPLVHVAPGIRPEVAGLVHRAMAPRAAMRFPSAAAMRMALEVSLVDPRLGTAKLGQVGAAFSPIPSAISAVAPLGTGTVMGAPAASVLAASGQSDRPVVPHVVEARLASHTVQAPLRDPAALRSVGAPVGYAAGYISSPSSSVPNAPSRARPRKGGSGLVVGLAVVALLLGAGAVAAYVAGTASPAPSEDPFAPPLATTVTVASSVSSGVSPRVTVAPPLTLAPPVNQPPLQPQPQPQPRPRPSGSTAPKPSSSVEPTRPFPPFPSAFPSGFPSAFPLPSGFPTFPIPSGFPTFFVPSPSPPQNQ